MIIDLRADAQKASSTLGALPGLPELNAMALATWRGRMMNEHTSALVFERLAAQLAQCDLEPELVAECAEFANEERRHGVLCGAVVESLGGQATFEHPTTEEFPEHEDVSRVEAALRNVVSISCLSETVAVALIGAERLEMPEGALRDLLTTIYADEVGHARFGWRLAARLIADLDAEGRARLGDYLAVAFEHLERHELAHLNPTMSPPKEGAQLGLCNGRDARMLFYATVQDVVVVGLEALGIPARNAWEARRDGLMSQSA